LPVGRQVFHLKFLIDLPGWRNLPTGSVLQESKLTKEKIFEAMNWERVFKSLQK